MPVALLPFNIQVRQLILLLFQFVMEFLTRAAYISYMSKPQLLPIFIFRMMKMSVSYGICEQSVLAFSWYGAIRTGVIGDIDDGYCWGRTALETVKRFGTDTYVYSVYYAYYGCIALQKEPVQGKQESQLVKVTTYLIDISN